MRRFHSSVVFSILTQGDCHEDEPCVREFLPFTGDLNEIATWLTACDV